MSLKILWKGYQGQWPNDEYIAYSEQDPEKVKESFNRTNQSFDVVERPREEPWMTHYDPDQDVVDHVDRIIATDYRHNANAYIEFLREKCGDTGDEYEHIITYPHEYPGGYYCNCAECVDHSDKDEQDYHSDKDEQDYHSDDEREENRREEEIINNLYHIEWYDLRSFIASLRDCRLTRAWLQHITPMKHTRPEWSAAISYHEDDCELIGITFSDIFEIHGSSCMDYGIAECHRPIFLDLRTCEFEIDGDRSKEPPKSFIPLPPGPNPLKRPIQRTGGAIKSAGKT